MDRESIRLKCLEIMIQNASRVDIERGACLELAEKAYEFVVKTSEKPIAEYPVTEAPRRGRPPLKK